MYFKGELNENSKVEFFFNCFMQLDFWKGMMATQTKEFYGNTCQNL